MFCLCWSVGLLVTFRMAKGFQFDPFFYTLFFNWWGVWGDMFKCISHGVRLVRLPIFQQYLQFFQNDTARSNPEI